MYTLRVSYYYYSFQPKTLLHSRYGGPYDRVIYASIELYDILMQYYDRLIHTRARTSLVTVYARVVSNTRDDRAL